MLPADVRLIADVNDHTEAGLRPRGRSVAGALGGAVHVEWPDGRSGVVTIFRGPATDARRVAATLNQLHRRGLPVSWHELVVDLGDRVVFVQQRLPAGPARPFGVRQAQAIAAVNDRFAAAAIGLTDVPPVAEWFEPGVRSARLITRESAFRRRDRAVLTGLLKIAQSRADLLEGDDIVHVDLNAANVLFDQDDRPTGVVDWNLGVFRGDRSLALVQTRFDREWFVRRSDARPEETAGALRLDDILVARTDATTSRVHWSFWLLHHLPSALRRSDQAVIDWQMELARLHLR